MKNLWKVTLWAIALLSMLLVLWGCGEDEPETPDEGTHTCVGEKWVTEKEATCQAEGSKKFVCSCGKTVKTEAIPKKAHTEVTVPGKAATCTATGLTDGKKCSSCGETLVEQTEISLASHTEETVPGKAATCTQTGLTDGKKCASCGETLVAQTEIPIDPDAHNVVNGTCTLCGYSIGTEIRTVADLRNIASNLNANYILMNDLDLGGMEWTPIGTDKNNPFTGTFDGNGHVIENFKITGEMHYAGLFGYSKGTIQNIGLENFTIDVSYSDYIYAGGLVGRNSGAITNSYATGDVSARSTSSPAYAGGLVGLNGGALTNCYATGDVSASNTSTSSSVYAYAGGLVGYNSIGTITNSYATGDVSASASSTGTDYYDVAHASAGGLVGYNDDGIITNSYATGDVSASSTSTSSDAYAYAGGLVGENRYYGTITNCYRYSGQSFTVTVNGTTTYSATNTEGAATSIENLQSKAWVEANLWRAEIEIWSFGSGYPALDYEAIDVLMKSVIEISTKEELLTVQGCGLLGNYKLMADIDLGGMEWQPIAIFFGTFDGNGHVIEKFKITGDVQYAGLFGYSYGTIQNLGVENFTIDVSYSGTIFAGGLVGENRYGTITNSYATGDVSASSTNTNSNAYANAGGLVGYNDGYYGDATITNCYATGAVSASSTGSYAYASAGGLVGYNSIGTITNSYATGDVIASASSTSTSYDAYAYAGGLVGDNYGSITNSYAAGAVSASASSTSKSDSVYAYASAGGLVGRNYDGTITNSYATGDVSASSTNTNSNAYARAGGLVGENRYGTITNSYATGDVSASSTSYYAYAYAGGLVGYNNDGTITNCYATGNVSASSTNPNASTHAGGLVGYNDGTTKKCYRYSGQSFTVTKNGTTTYEATNTVGTATDMATLQSVDFQQNTLGWSTSYWSFTAGAHPTLKNVGTTN